MVLTLTSLSLYIQSVECKLCQILPRGDIAKIGRFMKQSSAVLMSTIKNPMRKCGLYRKIWNRTLDIKQDPHIEALE